MRKKIAILGSTGSIGTQTLEVIDRFTESFEVVALTARKNVDLLARQCKKYQPKFVGLMDEINAHKLKELCDGFCSPEILVGEEGLNLIARHHDIDLIVNSLIGAVGLGPSYFALNEGKTLALANKESLVIAGEILTALSDERGGKIIPIDSEHSALFQLYNRRKPDEIKNLILTASGGPFRKLDSNELSSVGVEDALNHPNWDMGSKITIDSATLMNKGLEVIEAHWLFNIPYDRIKVVVHPQSIIHAMVEMVDNSIYAELSVPDMKISIQHALFYPAIKDNPDLASLDLIKTGTLTFEEPRWDDFPCLKLAYQAGKEGGFLPCVLNAANEVAVDQFLKEKISFNQIPLLVEKVMERFNFSGEMSLEVLLEVDQWSRKAALKEVERF